MLAWCGQGLEEHSLGSLKVVAKPEELKHRIRADAIQTMVKAIIARLARLSRLDVDAATRLVHFAVCIHDAGKAHPRYQRILRELCGVKEDRISLAGHELLSAWVGYVTAANPLTAQMLGYLREGDAVEAPLILAAGVALHHSARRSIFEAYYKLVKRLLPSPLDADFVNGASKVASVCLNAIIHKNIEHLVRAQLVQAARQPYPILNLVESMESLSRNDTRAAELLAYTIAVADNIDAWLHRGGFPASVAKRFIEGERV